MYAIRSYYAIGFLSLTNSDLTELLREAASDNPVLRLRLPPMAEAPEAEAQGRITSYNVCYTKLLRPTIIGVDKVSLAVEERLVQNVCPSA